MNKWISVHIFYTDSNFLLKSGIYPFLSELKDKQIIKQYFFIRYMEGGPHIRLRLLVNHGDEHQIIPFIKEYFDIFLNKFPSQREFSDRDLYPNNTVHFIEYKPEVDRYGGIFGVEVAERHFQDSSETVLRIMQDFETYDLSIAQGKAILLYVAFFRAVDLPENYVHNMLHIMNNTHWKDIAQAIVGKDRDIADIFEDNYRKNENAINAYIDNINNIISFNIDEVPYLSAFYSGVLKSDQELSLLWSQGRLVVNKRENTDKHAAKSILYISYLHMLNNRLGLKNHDEGYLSFVMQKTIRRILLPNSAG